MIPYETDPSLHGAEPEPAILDDGFSPPPEPPDAGRENQALADHASPPLPDQGD